MMRPVRAPWVLISVLCLAVIAPARADLDASARQKLNAGGLGSTQVGALVIDLASGEELVAINADEPMLPASNMKLVTTAAALRVLGPDFVFRTELRLIEPTDWPRVDAAAPAPAGSSVTASTPARGQVLLVRGDGDPGFGDPELLRLHGLDADQLLKLWVEAVRDAGVKHLERLIIDDRVFDRQFVHPTWPADQLHNWYCAQVAGLNFNDNCLDLYPQPTSPGQAPRVQIMPEAPFLSTTNRAITGKNDTFGVARRLGTNDLTFRGEVKTRRTSPLNVTVHDPPALFGQLVAHRLLQAGIRVESIVLPGIEERLPQGRPLHTVQTTLPMVLRRCNKDSQNLFAEALLKRMGREVTGAPGSFENGASAVRRVLADELGAASASVSIADGSGLSRENRVTARTLVCLLAAMHHDPRLAGVYRESLSLAGSDGTLQKRFTNFHGQVYGKSGFINGVSSLSGYLVVPGPSASGPAGVEGPALDIRGADAAAGGQRVIAFCFLFNNFKPPVHLHQVKAVQDQLVELLDRRFAPAPQRVGQGG